MIQPFRQAKRWVMQRWGEHLPSACGYCYHGVVDQRLDVRLERNFHSTSVFRAQVQWLRKNPVCHLETLPQALAHGDVGRASGFFLTFDDGYRNNLIAAEILGADKVPWTLFVSTGVISRRCLLWTVEVSLLLLHGECEAIELLNRSWSLKGRLNRESTFQNIRSVLKTLPSALRLQIMTDLRAQFPRDESARLMESFKSFQMLDWNEIRQLSAAGVEIGSHGVNHELHHAGQDAAVRQQELVDSKREIEHQLGKQCRYFAFPNGDFCAESASEVEQAGYSLAFTVRGASVRADDIAMLLPRITPGGSVARLRSQTRELS